MSGRNKQVQQKQSRHGAFKLVGLSVQVCFNSWFFFFTICHSELVEHCLFSARCRPVNKNGGQTHHLEWRLNTILSGTAWHLVFLKQKSKLSFKICIWNVFLCFLSPVVCPSTAVYFSQVPSNAGIQHNVRDIVNNLLHLISRGHLILIVQ